MENYTIGKKLLLLVYFNQTFFETQILHYPETRLATWENRLLVRLYITFSSRPH